MDTIEALKRLGVERHAIMYAGQIQGILEIAEESKRLSEEALRRHSQNIAGYILDYLFSKVTTEVNEDFRGYLSNNLITWIQQSLAWKTHGLEFNENILVTIFRPVFEKFNIEKDDLIEYLNKIWLFEPNIKYSLVKITDLPDTEKEVRFLFNLEYF
ncbi:hypothetical protein A3C57_00850 [Candidatus Nomurabacteria bacterium RIFCSPHIGHO2_02_FULL_33_12]|uniref:Uncharacterized protein n=1 Tax=Candidatus Nomurabacteria bacterium RIFCSPLOWO2_01_FULL_33_17 TaxID=1801764 RepID=A0A1F6WQQ4_9BACT|nr:MAG: hypothetical protein A3C57_00850 [Candidatus Nomurabacteria bacterium RIFCSPHIGHO2_02_FULL_33_12]OGI84186.1 MAG: hypothetical protein A2903_01475 [Candidatus Nomurabacteria bacterium RIFCSPLOWO2_01_FULL_33_17]